METEAFFKKTEVKFWKKLKTEPKNSECRRIDPTDASKKMVKKRAWPKKEHFFHSGFFISWGGIPGLEVKNYTPPLKILK